MTAVVRALGKSVQCHWRAWPAHSETGAQAILPGRLPIEQSECLPVDWLRHVDTAGNAGRMRQSRRELVPLLAGFHRVPDRRSGHLRECRARSSGGLRIIRAFDHANQEVDEVRVTERRDDAKSTRPGGAGRGNRLDELILLRY